MKGYDPEKGSQQDKDEHPEKYRLQGIYAGLVDDLAESLIEREPPQGDPRLISYGEFKKKYFEPSVNEMFSNIAKTLKMMSNEERQSFDWRRPEDEVTDEEVLVIPFNAVEEYLRDRLEYVEYHYFRV